MIYFIGAGPGAADLITVKGKELLEKADLVIYAGSLVNPELLKYCKPECTIMNSATMTLEEVIAAMVPAAQAGQLVVRLHTGDPSVYGAHREQIDLLRSYNLDYEVVPGVSSFCAAAACLKAEYTLPNVSQSVIITRMEGRTPVPSHQKIADYAAHKATMVIFLSSGMLEKLQTELVRGGTETILRLLLFTKHPGRMKRLSAAPLVPWQKTLLNTAQQNCTDYRRRLPGQRLRPQRAVQPDLRSRLP